MATGADTEILRRDGILRISTNCARANMWPCPFSAIIKEVMMATNHTTAENVTLRQQISAVASISVGILVLVILDQMCISIPGS